MKPMSAIARIGEDKKCRNFWLNQGLAQTAVIFCRAFARDAWTRSARR
jgi:hypothetical protein